MGLFRLILVVLSLGWFGGLWFFSSLQCDSYEIRPGKHLGVCISVANNRLFVGSIPKNKTKENILEEFSKVTEGLVDVILYHQPDDKKKNRGFCFLEYAVSYTHLTLPTTTRV